MSTKTAPRLELVEESVSVCGRELSILRPRDAEALLDEEAFEHEEFLPYWAELWPSALGLARGLCELPLRGARVLELGCGLAVPSITAASRGAFVLATDWSPDALSFAASNADRNGVALETALCAWSTPEHIVRSGPWDLVLASDVLYERRNVGLLLDLLPRLVDEAGAVLLSDPGRPAAGSFLTEAGERWQIETSGAPAGTRVSLYRLQLR